MVPNGKLIGKQLGDRYPGEEALERLKESAGKGGTDEFYEFQEGPGGRRAAIGQNDDDTRLIAKFKDSNMVG